MDVGIVDNLIILLAVNDNKINKLTCFIFIEQYAKCTTKISSDTNSCIKDKYVTRQPFPLLYSLAMLLI